MRAKDKILKRLDDAFWLACKCGSTGLATTCLDVSGAISPGDGSPPRRSLESAERITAQLETAIQRLAATADWDGIKRQIEKGGKQA